MYLVYLHIIYNKHTHSHTHTHIYMHKMNGSLMIYKNSEKICQQRRFNYSAPLSKD